MQKYAFCDEDLNKAGWRMLLPAKASFNVAYHCETCQIVIVDYGHKISSKEAKALL